MIDIHYKSHQHFINVYKNDLYFNTSKVIKIQKSTKIINIYYKSDQSILIKCSLKLMTDI